VPIILNKKFPSNPKGSGSAGHSPAVPQLPAELRKKLDDQIAHTVVIPMLVSALKPNPRNARKHSEHQLALLSEIIRKYGFTNPLLIDEENNILAGHARHQAAVRLGLKTVPTICVRGLSSRDKKALAIADNRVAELAEWDPQILAQELGELFNSEFDLDFDPRIIGFETVEIDQIITSASSATAPTAPDPDDVVAAPEAGQRAVTQPGDIWNCGKHRLLCGNALIVDAYAELLGDQPAEIVFTDPPYNVKNAGHVTSRPGVREFAMARGEKSDEEFIEFLHQACRNFARYSVDGAVAFLCMDWRHLSHLFAATIDIFGPPKNLIVWAKTNAGQGTFYRSQHELILPFVVGTGTPVNNFGLGAKGRYRTNVWTYPGCSSFGAHRDEALSMHPTVKPVALVKDALLDCSNRGAIVLDPFGGSGTTMVAAERTGRRARLIEIDPLYCDVIVDRWQRLTGGKATLATTNQTFSAARDAGRATERASQL
jgi:DNA modification methylase